MTQPVPPQRVKIHPPGSRVTAALPPWFRRFAVPCAFAVTIVALWAALIQVLAPDLVSDLAGKGVSDPRVRSKQIALAVKRIDAAMLHVLDIVAPGTEVLSNHEEQKALNGVNWRSARLELQLPPSAPLAKVMDALASVPYDEQWRITTRTFQLEPYSETLQVAVRDYPTHLVTIYAALDDVPPVHLATTDRPKVAILIDDMGYQRSSLDTLWQLEVPFSVAILPFSPFALAVAETAEQHLKEVLVHLPLEPLPDPEHRRRRPLGQITLSMCPDEIRSRAVRALRAVPRAVGVNNHEGSAFMRSSSHLRVLLDVVKRERMFFVDSRTTAQSRGMAVARALGVPCTDRQVFLDNDLEPKQIRRALDRLKEIAFKRGSALGIGHPHPATISVLAEWLPAASEEGLRLVPVSALTTLDGGGALANGVASPVP